jgi:hypothetical protein
MKFGGTLRLCGALLFLASALWGCGRSVPEGGRTFELESEAATAQLRYLTAPPALVFDSVRMELELLPGQGVPVDSLGFELLPAENGWCRAEGTQLKKNPDGWYRGAFWMRPTVPGQFVVSWQTSPFTGFTFYLAARYDSTGHLVDWSETPTLGYPSYPLVVRDTMEIVYRRWPQVWARRLHFVRRDDAPREFYLITQSWERSRGVSGRRFEYSANLVPNPQFPLRSRSWEAPGWVVDTLSVWVRDTLVAWVAWSYDEFVDNWERNTTLFRDWQHTRQPELFFKIDTLVHLAKVWTKEPANEYIAARMYADTSKPAFDSLKRAFMYGPTGAP